MQRVHDWQNSMPLNVFLDLESSWWLVLLYEIDTGTTLWKAKEGSLGQVFKSDLRLEFWWKIVSLTVEARVGKKHAIYLPKAVVEATGLKEGKRVLLRVAGNNVVLESLRDPIELALSGKKFASIKPEQVEAISLKEQASRLGAKV